MFVKQARDTFPSGGCRRANIRRVPTTRAIQAHLLLHSAARWHDNEWASTSCAISAGESAFSERSRWARTIVDRDRRGARRDDAQLLAPRRVGVRDRRRPAACEGLPRSVADAKRLAGSGSGFGRRAEAGLAKMAGGGRFRVYGNLALLHYFADSASAFRLGGLIDSIHIVIQLEVAERIVARPGRREYGYLSVACQFYAAPKIALWLPPGAFRPPPKVESALVSMTLPGERAQIGIRGAGEEGRFLEFVQTCFSQKRKTLRNNLRAIATDERIHTSLAELGFAPMRGRSSFRWGSLRGCLPGAKQDVANINVDRRRRPRTPTSTPAGLKPGATKASRCARLLGTSYGRGSRSAIFRDRH